MTADEFLTSMPNVSDDQEGMQQRDALDSAKSLADHAAATASNPEAVGLTLRVFADRQFTGEAVFELVAVPGAVIRVHLDAGQPYVAERVGDEPIGRRLVAAGAIEAKQLQRGMVLVGDVEHLGRLFQRERTIDRDVVVAAVAEMTAELLSEVADDRATVTITPYRHHRSGIHRWFVGPRAVPSPFDSPDPASRTPDAPEITQMAEPLAAMPDVGSFDPPDPLGRPDGAVGGLTVEWAEPISAFDPPVAAPFDADAEPLPPLIMALPEPPAAGIASAAFGAPPEGPAIQLAPPTAPAPVRDDAPDAPADDDVAEPVAVDAEIDEREAAGVDHGFTMVWPDGSEVGLDGGVTTSTASDPDPEPEPVTPSLGAPVSTESPAVDVVDPLLPNLDITSPSEGTTSDDDLPEDVAEAVRRALAAIERAASDPAVPARLGGAAVDLPSLNLEPVADEAAAGTTTIESAPTSGSLSTVPDVAPAAEAVVAPPETVPSWRHRRRCRRPTRPSARRCRPATNRRRRRRRWRSLRRRRRRVPKPCTNKPPPTATPRNPVRRRWCSSTATRPTGPPSARAPSSG